MTRPDRKLARAFHDISRMLIVAAEMHRQHTRLLVVLVEAGANPTDVIVSMRANEEMFAGYLTRISALSDTARITILGVPDDDAADACAECPFRETREGAPDA